MAHRAEHTQLGALASAPLVIDERAFEDLLKEHQALAYSVAYRLLGREPDARDAVQDAFLLAWRALRGDGAPLREAGRFRPWLLRIVANAAARQFRVRPNSTPVAVDNVAHMLRAPSRNEPGAEAERRDTRRDLICALLVLPRKQRGVLILREFHHWSYDEIAQTLHQSRACIEARLFRARQSWRAAFETLTSRPRRISCAGQAVLVDDLVDNELDLELWLELTAHIEDCPKCPDKLEWPHEQRGLRRLVALLASAAGLHSPTAPTAGAAAAASSTVGVSVVTKLPGVAGLATAATTAGELATQVGSLTGAKAASILVAVALGASVTAAPTVVEGRGDVPTQQIPQLAAIDRRPEEHSVAPPAASTQPRLVATERAESFATISIPSGPPIPESESSSGPSLPIAADGLNHPEASSRDEGPASAASWDDPISVDSTPTEPPGRETEVMNVAETISKAPDDTTLEDAKLKSVKNESSHQSQDQLAGKTKSAVVPRTGHKNEFHQPAHEAGPAMAPAVETDSAPAALPSAAPASAAQRSTVAEPKAEKSGRSDSSPAVLPEKGPGETAADARGISGEGSPATHGSVDAAKRNGGAQATSTPSKDDQSPIAVPAVVSFQPGPSTPPASSQGGGQMVVVAAQEAGSELTSVVQPTLPPATTARAQAPSDGRPKHSPSKTGAPKPQVNEPRQRAKLSSEAVKPSVEEAGPSRERGKSPERKRNSVKG